MAAVLWPLLRRPASLSARADHDIEVYGAQLRELQGDLDRGAIAGEEAASARAEIGRRLLKAASRTDRQDQVPAAPTRSASLFAVAVVVVALVGAVPIYAVTGKPGEADMPLAARLAADPSRSDVAALVAQAEARLRADPDDGRGWEALLPFYLRAGRTEDALRAADNAIRLLGATAEREVLRGEARMQAASGAVDGAAKLSFDSALALDPANGPARFYLALALAQAGDLPAARAAWQAVADAGPPDAAWVGASRMAVATTDERIAAARGPASTPGPSAGDIEAASTLSDADRSAMVQGMVSQLAARLDSAPNDPDGWKRLIRSYAVLGNAGEARAAHEKARGIFADGSPERRSIDEFAAMLGLGDDDKAVR